MACFSYIADITKLRSRTTRIAFLDLGFSLGGPLGMLLSDFLYNYMGYLGIYSAGAVVLLIACLYTIIRVRDTKGPNQGSMGEVYRRGRMCRDLFDTENVKKSFSIAFKRRPDKGRMKILILIGAMCVMVAEFGECWDSLFSVLFLEFDLFIDLFYLFYFILFYLFLFYFNIYTCFYFIFYIYMCVCLEILIMYVYVYVCFLWDIYVFLV